MHCGKFQDALEPLLSWLSDTEELVANQKPPSAEYRVVKAQIQEQKVEKSSVSEKSDSDVTNFNTNTFEGFKLKNTHTHTHFHRTTHTLPSTLFIPHTLPVFVHIGALRSQALIHHGVDSADGAAAVVVVASAEKLQS